MGTTNHMDRPLAFRRSWSGKIRGHNYVVTNVWGESMNLTPAELKYFWLQIKADFILWKKQMREEARVARESRKAHRAEKRRRRKQLKEKRRAMHRSKKFSCTRCHTLINPKTVKWSTGNRPYCSPCYADVVWEERVKWTRPGHPLYDYTIVARGHLFSLHPSLKAVGVRMPPTTIVWKQTGRTITSDHLQCIEALPPLWLGQFPENVTLTEVANAGGGAP